MSNVKPGDLAMVAAPFAPCGRGTFVTVVRAASLEREELSGRMFEDEPRGSGQAWVCEGFVRWDYRGHERVIGPLTAILDCCLRRIDPPDEGDEVLDQVRLGLPAHQPQEA
jgi:hypothetical protein